jgi:hypothetical protein
LRLIAYDCVCTNRGLASSIEAANAPIGKLRIDLFPSLQISAAASIKHFDQLFYFRPPVAITSCGEGVSDTMLEMMRQHFLFYLVERSAERANLREYVNAIAVFFDHACHAANLALNSAESGKLSFLCCVFHPCTIPP